SWMARELSISKYWASRGKGALGSSKVLAKLTPSMGAWATPLMDVGILSFSTSSTVGTRSMAWMNWWRMSPRALMPLGQWTMHRSEVPPRATTSFQRRNGVLVAHAQPHEDWG